jgi:hypothetical protein
MKKLAESSDLRRPVLAEEWIPADCNRRCFDLTDFYINRMLTPS